MRPAAVAETRLAAVASGAPVQRDVLRRARANTVGTKVPFFGYRRMDAGVLYREKLQVFRDRGVL